MRHLCAYLGALVREWFVFAAGGLLLADVRIYQESGHVVRPEWYLGALATVYVIANYRVWAKERLRAIGGRTAEAQDAASPRRLARALAYVGRLVLCGGIGGSTLVVGMGCVAGTLYVWFMAGVPPWAQAREWGLAAPLAWLVIGVGFAGVSVLGAFSPDIAASRVAVVGITLGLATLWVLAVRRALQSRRQAH
jgi:hypothetical protein